MKHTMMVPGDIWNWGKKHFQTISPGDDFRFILAEAKVKSEIGGGPSIDSNNSAVVVNTNNGTLHNATKAYDPETYSDPQPAKFPGYCWGSGERINVGDLICIKNKRTYLFKWVRENT